MPRAEAFHKHSPSCLCQVKICGNYHAHLPLGWKQTSPSLMVHTAVLRPYPPGTHPPCHSRCDTFLPPHLAEALPFWNSQVSGPGSGSADGWCLGQHSRYRFQALPQHGELLWSECKANTCTHDSLGGHSWHPALKCRAILSSTSTCGSNCLESNNGQ